MIKFTAVIVAGVAAAFVFGTMAPAHAVDCREAAKKAADAKSMVSEIRHEIFLNTGKQNQHLYRMDVIETSMDALKCTSLLDAATNLEECRSLRQEYRSLVNEVGRLTLANSSANNELVGWLDALDHSESEFETCTVTETTIPARPPSDPQGGESTEQPEDCTADDSFTHYPNQAIAGNNMGSTGNVTVAECQQLCLDTPKCRSIDYSPKTKGCFLSDKSSADIGKPGVYFVGRPKGQPDWPYDYYERICN